MIEMSVFDKITNKEVREWYEKNLPSESFLRDIVRHARRYTLDENTGLLVREPFKVDDLKGVAKNLKNTVIDIIFPRPVDLHYHKDVDEFLFVDKGRGAIYLLEADLEILITPGSNAYIPKKCVHSFRPDKNDFLEIRIACSGKLNPSKEICVTPFNKIERWNNYYERKR